MADIMNSDSTQQQQQRQQQQPPPDLRDPRTTREGSLSPLNSNNPFRNARHIDWTRNPFPGPIPSEWVGEGEPPSEEERPSTGGSMGTRDFAWRMQPGQFRIPQKERPDDFDAYSWSNLAHQDRREIEVKLPLPMAFDDTEEDVEAYINRVSFFISIHSHRFKANADQVYLFLQGCTGKEGRPWAAGVMKTYLNERGLEARFPTLANLAQISARFRKRFGTIERARAARAKLEVLKQESRSVRSYVADFELLMQDANYDNNAQVQAFRRGLDVTLRRRIDNMDSRPEDIEDWKEVALDKDAALRTEREEEKAWSAASAHKAGSVVPKASASGSEPPVVRAQAFTRLTDEERRRLRSTNSCFYCRQPGHVVLDCPKRQERGNQEDGTTALAAKLMSLSAEDKAKLKESLKDF